MISPLELQIRALTLLCIGGLLCPLALPLSPETPAGAPLRTVGWLVISAAIMAGGMLPLLGISNALLATALGVLFTVAMSHQVAALAMLLSLLLVRPWEGADGTFAAALPRLAAGLTIVRWGAHRAVTRDDTVRWSTPLTYFVGFVLWLTLTAPLSSSPGESLSFLTETFVPIAALLFLTVNSLHRPDDFLPITRAIVLAVLGVTCAAGAGMLFGGGARVEHGGRLHTGGMWGNSNDLAALVVLTLPLLFGPYLARGSQSSRAAPFSPTVSLIMIGLFLLALAGTESRGAFAGIGCIFFAFLCLQRKLTKRAVALGIMGALAAAIMYVAIDRSTEDLSGSTSARANYLIAGIRMVREHPLIGVGANNYAKLYERYTPEFVEWGERTAHSSWILALAEGGIVGGGLMLGLALSVARRAWHLRASHPELFLSVIGYGVTMSFLSHTYLFLPYLLVGLVVAVGGFRGRDPVRLHAARPATGRGAVLAMTLLGVTVGPPPVAHATEILEASPGIEKPTPRSSPPMTRSLHLRGSRGETLPFLLRIRGEAGCAPLRVEHLSSVKTKFFLLPPVVVTQPSFPGAPLGEYLDPAVPLADLPLCATAGGDSWALGEVAIPPDAPPGTYEGAIGWGTTKIPLALSIWRMKMPTVPRLPIYAEMTPWFAVLGHYGGWNAHEPTLAAHYTRAMLNHGVVPLKSEIARPPVAGKGLALRLNLDAPSLEASFRRTVLSLRPHWAYLDLPTVGASGFEPINYDDAARYFSAIEGTFGDDARRKRLLVYLWDEPKPKARAALLRLSQLVATRAPSLRQLVTTTIDPDLARTVDIFAPVADHFDRPGFPPPSEYRAFQHGPRHEVWWYVSCMSHGCDALRDSGSPDLVIERPAAFVRVIGWLSMRYHFDAFLYYSVNNGYREAPGRDPWKSLWDFSGNGDGTLFYPGRPGMFGLRDHVPIPSLRLKLLRESTFDAQYIAWMNELKVSPPWWPGALTSLSSSMERWDHDYGRYRRMRDRMGEYLNGARS